MKYQFPNDFIWGTATSSYQIEGAWMEGGKGPSIWDGFSNTPGKVHNNDNGNVACDHFHKYKEDVALMADMKLPAYRLSISWPRIQPMGKGRANKEGIAFYSDLIDELQENNITPWVTLYHWDMPLALQMEHDGWLNPDIANYFQDYAALCFEHFGDRVKNWITLNEAWVVAILGYGQGAFAPGRLSNSEPYQVGHNLLRAHAKAVQVYRDKFQSSQGGRIGITNNCDWREPLTDKEADRQAAERALEFFLGWFANPIYHGDYPEVMRSRLGDRLPQFSEQDRQLIQGSSDFFGLNHYTTMYTSHFEGVQKDLDVSGNGGIMEDQDVMLTADDSWEKTEMDWAIVPWGLNRLLHWIDKKYGHPEIIVTENGCALDDQVENGQVQDQGRIDFYQGYLTECHNAIKEGVDVRGYFGWSFMDNFEWALGYSKRFGLHYVDFDTLERIPKSSSKWFKQVIGNNGF